MPSQQSAIKFGAGGSAVEPVATALAYSISQFTTLATSVGGVARLATRSQLGHLWNFQSREGVKRCQISLCGITCSRQT
jgi:hypothetical protein